MAAFHTHPQIPFDAYAAAPGPAQSATERDRMRALRAERLARLRPATAPRSHPMAEAAPRSHPMAEAAPRSHPMAETAPRSGPVAAPAPLPVLTAGGADDGALARILRALNAGPEAPPSAPAAAVLHFHRPATFVADPTSVAAPAPAAPVCDLDLLPGMGPDLVWALTRAGVTRRADLAKLEAGDLAARLGAIGRLAPVVAWIVAARAANPAAEA